MLRRPPDFSLVLGGPLFQLLRRTPLADDALLIAFLYAVGIVLGPLLVFTPQLLRANRSGLRAHSTLAERYVREFDAKWVRPWHPSCPWR